MGAGKHAPRSDRTGHALIDRFALLVGPWCAGRLIVTLRHLMTWTSVGEEVVTRLHEQGRPYVHAFYHDQLLMMTYSYLGSSYGRRLAVLSSRHRDGEYVSRTLERFGHRMVRGSTGRGGVGGLSRLIRELRAGCDVAIAVDGPRGPRHRAQLGAIEAARLGRAPIVPVAFAASRAWTLRSWDAFQVPLPLSHAAFVYGKPIDIPPQSDRDAMEQGRRELESRLEHLTARARSLAQGVGGSSTCRTSDSGADPRVSSPRDNAL